MVLCCTCSPTPCCCCTLPGLCYLTLTFRLGTAKFTALLLPEGYLYSRVVDPDPNQHGSDPQYFLEADHNPDRLWSVKRDPKSRSANKSEFRSFSVLYRTGTVPVISLSNLDKGIDPNTLFLLLLFPFSEIDSSA
jgi:hypothetical protein